MKEGRRRFVQTWLLCGGEVVRVEKVVERGKVRSWSLRADTRPIIDRQSVLEGHNLFYSGPSQPWF